MNRGTKAAITRYLKLRPDLPAAGRNMGWLMIDRVLRLTVGVLVFALLARHLGPTDFGSLNFVLALASIFAAFTPFGLDGILARDLVRTPEHSSALLGTTLLLQMLSGCIAMALMCTVGYALVSEQSELLPLVAAASLLPVLRVAEIVKYPFEAKVSSRYPIAVECGVFLLMSGARMAMIEAGFGLSAFVAIAVIEASLIAIGLTVLARNSALVPKPWHANLRTAKSLLRQGWPLVLSAAAVMIYMRIDQIMLAEISSEHQLGLYSAAIKVSEAVYLIPIVLVASMYPAILALQASESAHYQARMQELLDLLGGIAIFAALALTFSAPLIITLLYGSNYAAAAPILQIHAWACLFVFMGVAGSRWYIAEGKQRLSASRTIAGALTNVALNLLLIPWHGALGAAIATVISYAVAAYLLDATSAATRPLFRAKTLSLLVLLRAIRHRHVT